MNYMLAQRDACHQGSNKFEAFFLGLWAARFATEMSYVPLQLLDIHFTADKSFPC